MDKRNEVCVYKDALPNHKECEIMPSSGKSIQLGSSYWVNNSDSRRKVWPVFSQVCQGCTQEGDEQKGEAGMGELWSKYITYMHASIFMKHNMILYSVNIIQWI